MKLTVKNFGPIGEAKDIRISPMTLFVGPSNTGKSYLAVLLYAAVKALSPLHYLRPLSKESAALLDSNMELPKRAKLAFGDWTPRLAETWQKQVLYYFGEEGETLLRGEGASVSLCSDDGAVVVNLLSPKKSKVDASVLSAAKEDRQPEGQDFYMLPLPPPFLNYFCSVLWSETPVSAHYLPAVRGGIMQSHRGLADAAMAQVPLWGWGDPPLPQATSAPMFTGVLSDFIRKLMHLPDRINSPLFRNLESHLRLKDIIPIGERMERDIMGGGINVHENKIGYPDFRYEFPRNGGKSELSLNNSSAMVSELAPVSLFIRYHLVKGDLFVLEEPETNLHPAAQRAIADILAELVNAGVFVLATTHSDIVLEQINNAVRSGKLGGNGKSRKKGGSVSLGIDKVSAYAFDSVVKGKTKVKKVDFDGTDGFISDDHLRASTDLYNDTVGLMDAAHDD